MGYDVIDARHDTRRSPKPKAHIDIANLRNRRVRNHPADITLLNRADRAHNHSYDTKYKQHIDYLAVPHNVKSYDTVENLYQKENISFRNQGRQDRRRRKRGVSISIRQPAMKRVQRTFNSNPDGHQPHGNQQRNMITPVCVDKGYLLPDITHQQMSRQIIQKADSQQKQTGAEQAHNHIARRRHQSPSILPYHNQPACRNRIDFYKYISRKQIVRINQRQQRAQQQVYHNIVKILLGVLNLLLTLPDSSQHTEQHNHTEKYCHNRFQHAYPYFISPGRRKMPHCIDIFLPGPQHKSQHCRRHAANDNDHRCIYPFRFPAAQYRAQGAGKQREDNRHKRKILYKCHYSPSFLSLVEISSKSSVWYLRYRRMVRDSISAVTETDTTIPVSTSPLGIGFM